MSTFRSPVTVVLVAIGLQVACAAATAQSNVVQLSPGEPVHRDATQFLLAWKQAVITRNVEQLSQHTWPEYRAAVAKSLAEPSGKLHRALYGGENPIIQLLTSSTSKELSIFTHRVNAGGEHVVGCYAVQPDRLAGIRTFTELMKRSDQRSAFCLSLVRENRTALWMVDYTFAGEI